MVQVYDKGFVVIPFDEYEALSKRPDPTSHIDCIWIDKREFARLQSIACQCLAMESLSDARAFRLQQFIDLAESFK